MPNLCVECKIDMGECNPRQYCAKTHCKNEGLKFDLLPEWKEDLDSLGFAVVENVLNEKECEDLIQAFGPFGTRCRKETSSGMTNRLGSTSTSGSSTTECSASILASATSLPSGLLDAMKM